MTIAVNAGPRLDRLPASSFHRRMLALIAGGMFLDAFEIYLAGGVLGALVKSGWSNMALNADFLSSTFLGMVIGAWAAGLLGDHYGRRFSYQMNLLIFGIASLAGAAAPSIGWLIGARFFMGLGLGAEIVIGYATMSEFVPPAARGRWVAALAVFTNAALFISAVTGYLIIPHFGWRWMFVISGVGALIVWYLRKAMPESPRWLESKGRLEEADQVLCAIEAEVARTAPLPPIVATVQPPVREMRPLSALFSRQLLARTIIGTVIACVTNATIYGFIAWLPTFFVKQGMGIASSLGFTMLMSFGGPVGALIAFFVADRVGRKPVLIATCTAAIIFGMTYPHLHGPVPFVLVGFGLVTSIYVLVGVGFAIYIPELFPTDLRMRGNGFANTLGRIVAMLTPYAVVPVYMADGVGGVTGVISLLLAVMAASIWIVGIETRQKSLEELAGGPGDGAEPLLRRTLEPLS
jgi:putative MFS transporter